MSEKSLTVFSTCFAGIKIPANSIEMMIASITRAINASPYSPRISPFAILHGAFEHVELNFGNAVRDIHAKLFVSKKLKPVGIILRLHI